MTGADSSNLAESPSPLPAEVLVPGSAGDGEALVLTAPISFWGGVDPKTGRIADVRHPQCGESIAGKVLFLPGTIGSSSASAVLLELVHAGLAPAVLVLHEPDAILLLGLIVAREMGWEAPIAVKLDRTFHDRFRGQQAAVGSDGAIKSYRHMRGNGMISVSAASTTEDFEVAANLCRALGEWDADAAQPYGISREEVLTLFHNETAATLTEKYRSAEARMLVARSNGSPAGCLAFDLMGDTAVELQKFYVDARFRGRGIGRALMRAALDEIGRGPPRKVVIHTTFYMKEAISVYEAFGFTLCPRFRETPANIRHTDVFMSRTI